MMFDLKKTLFYYLFSWRTTLLCILLCVALVIGLAYLQPEIKDGNVVEQEEKLSAEKRNRLIAENEEAKEWAAEIIKLEGELTFLDSELSNSLFLQIDPDNRLNKRFDLRFTYTTDEFQDEAEKIKVDRILCLQYMRQLSDDRYMKYLATRGILKFDQTALIDLVEITIEQDGYIKFTVTGPDEVIIDQLIKTTQDYLEQTAYPEIDLFATHFLAFGEITEEVVKDPTIFPLKNKIEGDIAITEKRIDELNQMINKALEESLNGDKIVESKGDTTARPSLLKYIVIGLLSGLIVSAIITVLRYRREVIRTNVVALARDNQIAYLGVIPYYAEKARRRGKRICERIDRFFISMFGMVYDPEVASHRADYVARVIQGKVDALTENIGTVHPVNILVPDVHDDVSAGTLVTYIRRALELDGSSRRVGLIAGGSLEHDPETIEAIRECSGLLLLSKPSIKRTSLANSIRRSNDLSKEIVGIVEMDERW